MSEPNLSSNRSLKEPRLRRGLRRSIGIGGLFSIGHADVGAGIYLALGLVTLYAGYAAPLAIGVAAIAYALTGLTYAELSSTYPKAGGSATFARVAFGDGISFLAGWMLCLDYVVTAAIFSIPAIGYLSYFAPWLKQPVWLGVGAILMLTGLVLLNIIGIRESVTFTLTLCLLDIISEVVLIILGLVLVLIPTGALLHWPYTFNLGKNPTWSEFVQGITLAMVSYLGIEAVAQAAEETKIAGRTVPRATMLTVSTVVALYLIISVVAVNLVSPEILSTEWKEDPISGVASALPLAGWLMAGWIAILGSTISITAANAGIIGFSRMLYALSQYKLLPKKFGETHPKFRTPHVSILTLGFGSILLVSISIFAFQGEAVDPLVLLGSLYNVGALFSYVNAHLGVIVTRNTERTRFKPFKVPISLHFRRNGEPIEIPLLPLLGFIVTGVIWLAVVATHELGRLLGLIWIIAGFSIYVCFRKINRLPIWRRAEI
ncbi:MAG: APC family permease [Candidatus Bathyarchaeia archaeon]